MRQVLALTAAATFTAASFAACGGGSADTEEVGARKAACNNAPDFALAAYRPTALPPDRCQVVQLDVTRRVSGADPGTSIMVVKPLAPYVLKAGQSTSGTAFLVAGGDPFPIILGRYGPYPSPEVEAALGTGQ